MSRIEELVRQKAIEVGAAAWRAQAVSFRNHCVDILGAENGGQILPTELALEVANICEEAAMQLEQGYRITIRGSATAWARY